MEFSSIIRESKFHLKDEGKNVRYLFIMGGIWEKNIKKKHK